LLPNKAHAIQSGNDLLQTCEEFERSARSTPDGRITMATGNPYICWGYMNAVQHLISIVGDDGKPLFGVCAPEASTLTQLIRVFNAYARAHPADLHLQAGAFATTALRAAYPCRR
jgi:hypothetical protein